MKVQTQQHMQMVVRDFLSTGLFSSVSCNTKDFAGISPPVSYGYCRELCQGHGPGPFSPPALPISEVSQKALPVGVPQYPQLTSGKTGGSETVTNVPKSLKMCGVRRIGLPVASPLEALGWPTLGSRPHPGLRDPQRAGGAGRRGWDRAAELGGVEAARDLQAGQTKAGSGRARGKFSGRVGWAGVVAVSGGRGVLRAEPEGAGPKDTHSGTLPPSSLEPQAPKMSLSKGDDSESEPPVKFVRRKDDITGDEYEDMERVEMSCGHAVDPGSLTAWCRSLMDQGYFELYCPADVDGGKCGNLWSYPEVRRCAVLSNSEQRDFERGLALLAAKLYFDFKECPSCKSLVERKDLTTIRVLCTICTSTLGVPHEFCWQCLLPWKGVGMPSDHCDNVGCRDSNLDILASCSTKDLPGSEIRDCPSIRACPTCGMLIEHKEKCKYMHCTRCHVEFCFACLELAQTCQATKAGAWFKCCAKPLAPRQSRIPVWHRRQ
ncbi:PREDICTED: uncharacterized protein LOC102834533 [Chrysochloris asiatica]|uniref:RBR-type E3 ubiquitin transferase n=1 Tax=Chrysochloris asiatica TaxID=185453 RepID=A0A9B0U2Y6_CHRAS|nr:PREDICTED: uncharacterized protein LOC102834533 [Chrysochloris asiatica]